MENALELKSNVIPMGLQFEDLEEAVNPINWGYVAGFVTGIGIVGGGVYIGYLIVAT
ncbi:hypothetical protein [Neobacillus sp. PS3-40]|uniref:hypothetical protein n=1 Tax=Neobacillus sp. PS3-40 TaxID=3070679 RepID=UPI0027DF6D9B|nr:hypothetical protein [Neobacillus sp. PS3-40]WML46155.1 hypothetical protein RCG20_09800 [Neobacillus sp. PS3-40]